MTTRSPLVFPLVYGKCSIHGGEVFLEIQTLTMAAMTTE